MSGSVPSRSRESRKPLLVFFSSKRCGPARRMDSLLDHLARKERDRLGVVRVDVEEDPATALRFRVHTVPTIVLVKDKRTVARVEGRARPPTSKSWWSRTCRRVARKPKELEVSSFW